MRTRLGEIELGNIIIALFLISFGAFACGHMIYDPIPVFNLDFIHWFRGFLLYSFLFILGLIYQFLEHTTEFKIPGVQRDTIRDNDKDILKLKKNGCYIYCKDRLYKKSIKNEIDYSNKNEVSAIDRIFFEYGPPFDEPWDFQYGTVHWFFMNPIIGGLTGGFFVLLPLGIIYFFFNLIF